MNNNEPNLLEILSQELLEQIFENLAYKDLLSMRQVSKEYKAQIDQLIFRPEIVIRIVAELNEQEKIQNINKFLDFYKKSEQYKNLEQKLQKNEALKTYEFLCHALTDNDVTKIDPTQLKSVYDDLLNQKINKTVANYLENTIPIMLFILNRPKENPEKDKEWQEELSLLLQKSKSSRFINLTKADLSNFITTDASALIDSFPYPKFNLKGFNLTGADLSGLRIPLDLSKSILIGANLESASFFHSDFSYADFSHAKLRLLNFSGSVLNGTNFSSSNLASAKFQNTNIQACNFSHASLAYADLYSVQAANVEFTKADLTNATFRQGNFKNANFAGAKISEADFYQADFTGANLSETNLQKAHYLNTAFLIKADLSKANLQDAHLMSAKLRGANLAGANIAGANLYNANLENVNLAKAIISPTTIFPEKIPLTVKFFSADDPAVIKAELPKLMKMISRHEQEHDLRAAIATQIASILTKVDDLNEAKDLLNMSKEYFAHRKTLSKYAAKFFTSHVPKSLQILLDVEKIIDAKMQSQAAMKKSGDKTS